MTRLELEINPFTNRIVGIGIDKKEREIHSFYVDKISDVERYVTFFNERYIIFINYNKRVEASCFKADKEGVVLDESILTKVKIVLTDNESTFI